MSELPITSGLVRSEDDWPYARPIPQRRRACKVCKVDQECVDRGWCVISSSGVCHDVDGDTTICGKDATGDGWWWPL